MDAFIAISLEIFFSEDLEEFKGLSQNYTFFLEENGIQVCPANILTMCLLNSNFTSNSSRKRYKNRFPCDILCRVGVSLSSDLEE